MKKLKRAFAVLACVVFLTSLLPACQEKPPEDHEAIVRAGLVEILSHQEVACEDIVSWEIDARFDYLVSCGSGQKFRVHVGKEGHVNVDGHRNTQSQQ